MNNLNRSKGNIWFPAKKIGWGWGFPTHIMGWMALCVWVALVIATVVFFGPNKIGFSKFLGLIFTYSIVLLIICIIKGEKLKWSWGNSRKK